MCMLEIFLWILLLSDIQRGRCDSNQTVAAAAATLSNADDSSPDNFLTSLHHA